MINSQEVIERSIYTALLNTAVKMGYSLDPEDFLPISPENAANHIIGNNKYNTSAADSDIKRRQTFRSFRSLHKNRQPVCKYQHENRQNNRQYGKEIYNTANNLTNPVIFSFSYISSD